MSRPAILVTGAAGAVGSALVRRLHAAGERVIATDRAETALPSRRRDLLVRPADLTENKGLDRLLRGADRVVHTAAVVDLSAGLDQLAAVNVEATMALYRAAAVAGVRRFVYLSAGTVYRLSATGTYRESDPLEANNGYERSKQLAEAFLQSQASGGPGVIILRPSLIYGPGTRHLGASLACLAPVLQASMSRVIGLSGGPRINWVHVDDVAAAAAHLLVSGQPGEAYNVADDDAIGFGDLVSHSLRVYGLEPAFELPYPPMGLMRQAAPLLARAGFLFDGLNGTFERIWDRLCAEHELVRAFQPRLDAAALTYAHQHFLLLNDKLADTGFRPRYPSIEHGWAETIAWYQQQRWLPHN